MFNTLNAVLLLNSTFQHYQFYVNQDECRVESYTFLCPLISDVSLPALFMPTNMNAVFNPIHFDVL